MFLIWRWRESHLIGTIREAASQPRKGEGGTRYPGLSPPLSHLGSVLSAGGPTGNQSTRTGAWAPLPGLGLEGV